ncbi:hypothetical protein G7K_0938-t1 [Saitoella complicata NRRL Y-17804]|uniref:Uncharacterized protein n=1 Tax=Saitoella complicata (strain BCRC 22490 / CBS 7301 / JCM 7358 / NBRC 10748 / NRRL Y-17804) TaxID=698492 RepID=A0A0E9NAH8_SAICN|nr:hypothetical protein G7K_0938-t1 [Saitoella complicata NRRL Y-17804]
MLLTKQTTESSLNGSPKLPRSADTRSSKSRTPERLPPPALLLWSVRIEGSGKETWETSRCDEFVDNGWFFDFASSGRAEVRKFSTKELVELARTISNSSN